jgi:hypothetical protein
VKAVRNIFVTLGTLMGWLYLRALFAWPLVKLTNGIIYDEGVFRSAALGFMTSLPKSCAAAVCGALLTLVVQSRRPVFWGGLLALLTLPFGPRHIHAVQPLTRWDYESLATEFIFPALACFAASIFTARHMVRQRSSSVPSQSTPEQA